MGEREGGSGEGPVIVLLAVDETKKKINILLLIYSSASSAQPCELLRRFVLEVVMRSCVLGAGGTLSCRS